jgi:hypothetical protein
MKRWAGFAAILTLLALTAGCPYMAKAPLGNPDRNSFDTRLVGLWMNHSPDNEADSALIRVIPFNAAEYYIETDEAGGEPDRYRACVIKIGGRNFLQLNEIGHESAEPEYCFARYSFSENGELALRFVGDKNVPKDLSAKPKSLKAFLASHVGDSTLDDKDTNLMLRRRP